jgi:hypothetical protein
MTTLKRNIILIVIVIFLLVITSLIRQEGQRNAILQKELRAIANFQYIYMNNIAPDIWENYITEYEKTKPQKNMWEDQYYLNICKKLKYNKEHSSLVVPVLENSELRIQIDEK